MGVDGHGQGAAWLRAEVATCSECVVCGRNWSGAGVHGHECQENAKYDSECILEKPDAKRVVAQVERLACQETATHNWGSGSGADSLCSFTLPSSFALFELIVEKDCGRINPEHKEKYQKEEQERCQSDDEVLQADHLLLCSFT